MSDELIKVPKIRFKEFKKNWKVCKLKDITERVRGNDNRMDLPTLTISAGRGWLNQKERFSANIAGKEQKNYTLLSKGELSYNHGNSKLAKYGAVFSLRTYEEALVPKVYHSFKTNEKSNSDFIEYTFATKKPDRELGKLVSSGARMDGLLNINYEDFSNINLVIPELVEQKKISMLLRKLDEIIIFYHQEYDLLLKVKQSYLQKMFPKEGEKDSEIRFEGFKDDWKKSKLNDLVTQIIREVPKPKQSYERVSVRSHAKGTFHQKVNDPNSVSMDKLFVVKENDLIINITFAWEHAIAVANKTDDGLFVSHRFPTYRSDGKSDMNFLYYLVSQENFRRKLEFISPGGAGRNRVLNKKDFLELQVIVPSTIEEQQKIGIFFKQLDETIALHQREINQLKTIKQTLLQMMFI